MPSVKHLQFDESILNDQSQMSITKRYTKKPHRKQNATHTLNALLERRRNNVTYKSRKHLKFMQIAYSRGAVLLTLYLNFEALLKAFGKMVLNTFLLH